MYWLEVMPSGNIMIVDRIGDIVAEGRVVSLSGIRPTSSRVMHDKYYDRFVIDNMIYDRKVTAKNVDTKLLEFTYNRIL